MIECTLCPRNCRVDRKNKLGFCGAKAEMTLARAELHFWEEPYLCDGGASGAIFFSGCNLRCVYCQNAPISFNLVGKTITPSELVEEMQRLEDEGAENIDLITPTPYVEGIIEALKLYKPSVPVIYNCGGYESVDAIKALEGYVDIYLPDYKYISSELSARYSFAADYPERCLEALKEMRRQVKDEVVDGVMKKGLAVRHLVLPGEVHNTFGVLDSIAENLGKDTYVSLMDQYVPCGGGDKYPILKRKVTTLEYKAAVAHALKLELFNTFIQEGSAASEDFIPSFLRNTKE